LLTQFIRSCREHNVAEPTTIDALIGRPTSLRAMLEDYWGVGPKTSATLADALGVEAAVEAIEAGRLRPLVSAGVDRGRATRILRRAASADGMAVLATSDTRAVYRELLDLAGAHAVTRSAADQIRTLTPLVDDSALSERQTQVAAARRAWTRLDEPTKREVLEAYQAYDDAGERTRAALQTAVTLGGLDASGDLFDAFEGLDADALAAAGTALGGLDADRVTEDVDEELDRLRTTLQRVESMAASPGAVVESLRSAGVRDTAGFRDELLDHLRAETDVDPARVRSAFPEDATGATTFVSETLRTLLDELRTAVERRETAVRDALEDDIEAASDDIDIAVSAVDDVALWLSLARFAEAADLTRPEYVSDGQTIAISGARNLSLLDGSETTVQPITYAIGEHDLDDVPTGQQVAVLTGANSGGKTTLLETCCQVALLATMGLPVPADRAQLSVPERIVFHRRHASFNAGVLESTLRSVVPPLTEDGRTLMLVDEFEAITEPGRAADLLHGLVTLTVDAEALGAFVTHLADDLEPLPDPARTDGIFAEGLTDDLDLRVDYQPRFGEVGRSTPEFIVSRLVADASNRAERAGFETLAEAVDTEVVQRTLADAAFRDPADSD
jgi:hypothetical protein